MPVGSSISACGRHCNGSIFTIFGIYLRWIHLMHSVDLKKTSTSVRTIQFHDGLLKIEDIVDIAEGSASVALSEASLFLNLFATATQRNDLAVVAHSFDGGSATLIRRS